MADVYKAHDALWDEHHRVCGHLTVAAHILRQLIDKGAADAHLINEATRLVEKMDRDQAEREKAEKEV